MKDQEDKASRFLVKLLNMLRSKENAKTITWDVAEKGIRVLNQQKLEKVLLPKYFRHHKFSSFVRQLNMYDFHKVYMPDNTSLFYHQIFNPRDKESIYRIKRKASINDENVQVIRRDKEEGKKPLTEGNKELTPKIQEKSYKPSFKLLLKSTTSQQEFKAERQKNKEQVLEEVVTLLKATNFSRETIKEKISELRKCQKYQAFLKRHSFVNQVYEKLGLQMQSQDDKLSVLSIEEELQFDTKKSLTLKSMQMFDSGPINLKDTIGMLLN